MATKGDDVKCEICDAHTRAFETLPRDSLACPHCDTPLAEDGLYSDFALDQVVCKDEDLVVPPQKFVRTDLFRCDACGGFFMMQPVPVIWNANHDIYLTRPSSWNDACLSG